MQAAAFNAICLLLQLWTVSITFFSSVPASGSLLQKMSQGPVMDDSNQGMGAGNMQGKGTK